LNHTILDKLEKYQASAENL
jgi:hypothetical protein